MKVFRIAMHAAGALVVSILVGAAQARAGLPPEIDGKALPSLAPMLERVTPAVVNISSRTRVRVRDPFFDDPIFNRFFGLPNVPRERVEQSLGSGVVVDAKQGYVLTNNHVVQGADDISVTLTDGDTVKAEVVGTDAETDLAVLRIPAQGLTALPLADSTRLKVGDFVVAVGDPFGLGQTVTSGIVSALNRTGIGDGYQNLIQTDASINPGNSGGALVNLHGELVGINSMIYSPSGASVGIGFAIPSTLAVNVMGQLIAHGEVRRGALGVEVQDPSEQLARLLGLGDTRGAVVTRVAGDSPAARAGLRPGDVITAVGDQRIADARDLRSIESRTRTGAVLALRIVRDGARLDLTATLTAPDLAHADGASVDARLAGADLAERRAGASRAEPGGIAVTRVASDSRAFANGLRAGDLIVGLNRRDIAGLADFRRRLAQSAPTALLTVVRGRSAYFVALQ
jgi:serine protease DegQ